MLLNGLEVNNRGWPLLLRWLFLLWLFNFFPLAVISFAHSGPLLFLLDVLFRSNRF